MFVSRFLGLESSWTNRLEPLVKMQTFLANSIASIWLDICCDVLGREMPGNLASQTSKTLLVHFEKTAFD